MHYKKKTHTHKKEREFSPWCCEKMELNHAPKILGVGANLIVIFHADFILLTFGSKMMFQANIFDSNNN